MLTMYSLPTTFEIAYGVIGLSICVVSGVMLLVKRREHNRSAT